ncbi:hypothetical protein [Paucibacter sp. DJ2R-2]|uniref:hypothetical protein n=1 Tax=Paucibacter sp. DJ2R-2 TaxID=2893558 RepID=UPI0021E401FC|nr:hypothetical protein [Paucibacter sp. DJ2R-2]MCV2419954.1 hypothetical protein [Paucibacter sp. DJ4R-1]MCV2437119.1 hypothetical protein [Paucibacter sp. DJ2R-2]
MSRTAVIEGRVEYREGDGASMLIRPGLCEVEQGAQDATLSWVDGASHGAAAMPLNDFQRYLLSAAIRWSPDGGASSSSSEPQQTLRGLA